MNGNRGRIAKFITKRLKPFNRIALFLKQGATPNITSGASVEAEVLYFSFPIIMEQMLMSFIGIVNSIMVGGLGAYALSAVGLCNQPVFVCLAVFQSFNIGATALISRYIGGNSYKDAKKVVMHTLMLSILLGFFLSAILFAYAREVVAFMGAKSDTIEPATLFMKYTAVGVFFQAIPTAVSSILRGAGFTKPPWMYNTIANIVNVVVCYLLINGHLFFPALGLKGAAIGSTIAKITACILSIVVLMGSPYPVNYKLKDKFIYNNDVIKKIMNISLSAAGEQFIMRLGFLIFSKTIAELGTIALAAHQILNNITSILINVSNGIGMAASSYTGRFMGANRTDDIYKYIKALNKIGIIFAAIMLPVCAIGSDAIVGMFTNDKEVIKMASNVLLLAAVLTFPMNFQLIYGGALRGAGDTRWPLYITMVSMIVCRIGLTILFVNTFNWGLMGAWIAGLIDQLLRGLCMLIRFRRGKWKLIRL